MAQYVFKNGLGKGIKRYFDHTNKVIQTTAGPKVGLQLINNIVNGSPQEPVTPPIKTGALRGSGSVFIGDRLIKTTEDISGEGTPATSHSAKKSVITVVFNKPYAAKWHENSFNPGPVSLQSGNVGNKYIEKHLQHDGPELMKFLAVLIKKGNG
jgi:hypothetical protein